MKSLKIEFVGLVVIKLLQRHREEALEEEEEEEEEEVEKEEENYDPHDSDRGDCSRPQRKNFTIHERISSFLTR